MYVRAKQVQACVKVTEVRSHNRTVVSDLIKIRPPTILQLVVVASANSCSVGMAGL